ncbi:hypothetical protein HZH66_004396 [Vespula vulgaris]|uniref:Uncharacterized protein n=1 Tax=Vespula vulgaris TaxID=7454 RepID=A0A834KF55_VESVU|nr:hypothetical protein HZH66_004396 [Vespula vulgaris]
MKFIGIWPDERGFAYASSYRVLFPIGFMFFFITLPQTTNLYFIWGDFELIVENLSIGNMTTTIAILKAATFWSNGRYMKLLLSHMENDRKEASEKNVKKMMRIANISRRITAGSIIMYTIRIQLRAITVLVRTRLACCASEVYKSVGTFVATLVFHKHESLNRLKIYSTTRSIFYRNFENRLFVHELYVRPVQNEIQRRKHNPTCHLNLSNYVLNQIKEFHSILILYRLHRIAIVNKINYTSKTST